MALYHTTRLYLLTALLVIALGAQAFAVESKDVPAPIPTPPPVAEQIITDDSVMNNAKDTSVIEAQIAEPEAAASMVNKTVMDMPAITTQSNDPANADYPILRVTQDKSELVKLEAEAASVIVGNPNHISVLLDTPDTLVVIPRAPGASHFTVMGKDGSVIMQRHVIVGAAKEQYVRIRRSCPSGDRDCQAVSTYFCPDMCHEVQENNQPRTSTNNRR